MSRAFNEDYSMLLSFIDGYSIKSGYDRTSLSKIIKPIHKGYYSALVLLAEINHQGIHPKLLCAEIDKKDREKLFWLYLSESFSELGTAFFLILNGCYKAADQVSRSSIENFIKALGSMDAEVLYETKNVYEIFDKASVTVFFQTGTGKEAYKGLYGLYKRLCSIVHTGEEKDMQKISALGDFPAIDSSRAQLAKKNYLKIIRLYVSSLSVLFDKGFHNMHHRNQDIVQPSLSASALKELHKK
jgi:hypothetical protein